MRGASYSLRKRWQGTNTATTSEYLGFGVFLVWFCRFGTEALYWVFFLINTVLVLVCFAFALYRLYQCIGVWFSLLSLPATWPWVRWVSLIFDFVLVFFFFFFFWESVGVFALLGSPWAWLAMDLALLLFFFFLGFLFFFFFCLKVE